MDFEKKLNKKLLESLDGTTTIMKKIKSQYKDLSKKVKALENGTSVLPRKEVKSKVNYSYSN